MKFKVGAIIEGNTQLFWEWETKQWKKWSVIAFIVFLIISAISFIIGIELPYVGPNRPPEWIGITK